MRHLGTIFLSATLVTGCGKHAESITDSTVKSPPSKPSSGNASSPAEAMRGLRDMMLSTPATKLGIQRTDDFPRIYGVLLDWPLGDGNIISVVGLCDGNASLYTTSTFGIIGGGGHESVRRAAANFVSVADKFYADSIPTSDRSYPTGNRVKFYLVTFDGLRVIDSDMDSISSGKDKLSELFNEGQKLLTELRLTMEKKSQ